MTNIALDGYFGMGNAGDDAFCAVTAAIAAKHRKGVEVGVLAPAERLPMHASNLKALLPHSPRFRGHTRLASARAVSRATDVLHIGGSTLSRVNSHLADQARLRRLGFARLHAAAVGVGPFRSEGNAAAIKSLLEGFETVSVRDQASMDRLAEVGFRGTVNRVADVAVLVPELFDLPSPSPADGRPTLGVSVCGFEKLFGVGDPEDEDRRNDALVEIVRSVVTETNARVRMIVFNRNPRWGDDQLCAEFARRLADTAEVEVVSYTGDIVATFEAIGGCDALLGMRLHSAIFAYAIGVPFGIVSYHRKCSDFARDVGLADDLILPGTGIDRGRSRHIVSMLEPGYLSPVIEPSAMRLEAWKAYEGLPWHP